MASNTIYRDIGYGYKPYTAYELAEDQIRKAKLNVELTLGNEKVKLKVLPPSIKNLKSLKVLRLTNTEISSLPELPDTLEKLDCFYNKITTFEAPLPPGLKILSLAFNQLTELPPLPPTLEVLNVASNQLSVLPTLPETLLRLNCNENQLSVLPPLPPILRRLECKNNQLVELPLLPPTLRVLDCENNRLEVLPPIPDSIEEMGIGGNPFLPEFQAMVDSIQAEAETAETDEAREALMPKFREQVASFYERYQTIKHNLRTLPERKEALKAMANVQSRLARRNELSALAGPASVISSFLVGGPGGLKQQQLLLKEIESRGLGLGVGRGGRKQRTHKRKGHKAKTRKQYKKRRN